MYIYVIYFIIWFDWTYKVNELYFEDEILFDVLKKKKYLT